VIRHEAVRDYDELLVLGSTQKVIENQTYEWGVSEEVAPL
jgi:hypothetical protein